jgi:uncharacterized protein (DUF1684 family)
MLDLLDWRRRISDLYREVRATPDPESAWIHWREVRDDLFRHHSQSPLDADQQKQFRALPYFPYDACFRITARVEPAEPATYRFDLGENGSFMMRRFGRVAISLPTGSGTLNVYWIEGYGGGVFLPFRDATNRSETYGAGRYLLDTIKGADLGASEDGLVLDFNFAYHPSCAYHYRWVCPLAPAENTLSFPMPVGERL